MISRTRRFVSTTAALAIAAALGSTAVMAGKAEDTLNAAFSAEVTTLDSYKESGREGLVMARLIYDGLLYKDMKTGEFKPEIAESFKVVDDKTIDFTLRRGVKFHNGQELTADDVAYTLNLVSSKEYNARYQIAVEWIERVEKTGDYAVRLHMKTANPIALEMLAGNLPIYPKAYYEQAGSQGMSVKPIGAGPYRVAEVTPGSRYVLERFDGYYAGSPKGAAKIKRMVMRVLPEANTQYAELVSGQLDWIWRVPPDDARNLSRQSRVAISNAQIMRFAYIGINPNYQDGKSPLADVRVRQAINMAVDKPGIVKALVGGASQAIASACNPIQFGCETNVPTYAFDAAKAKALLAEAGHPNGIKLDLVFASLPKIQAEAIAANLAKAGIQVTLNEQQYAPAISAWREGRAPLLLTNWGSYGVGDVGLSVGQFFSGTGDDLAKDKEIIPLLQGANTSMDRDKRKADYSKALKLIAERAYWVPLWTYNVNTAHSKDLDVVQNADEFVDFHRAYWK
jgi:peptide/nickel transport system substrate-binding protein